MRFCVFHCLYRSLGFSNNFEAGVKVREPKCQFHAELSSSAALYARTIRFLLKWCCGFLNTLKLRIGKGSDTLVKLSLNSVFRPEKKAFYSPEDAVAWDFDNHFEQVESIYGRYNNSFEYYEWMIDELDALNNTALVPLCRLFTTEIDERNLIGLRHDVDMDPISAVRCAQKLALNRLSGSFYLLHTNPYFGNHYGRVFARNLALNTWVRQLVVTGSEVGIHHDALHLYLNLGVDGISRLREDIKMLRGLGAHMIGAVSHNSGPIYGAENYEIFSDMLLWPRPLRSRDNLDIPLGSIKLSDLGIQYEGTFAIPRPEINMKEAEAFFSDSASSNIRSENWMKTYLLENPTCTYKTHCQFWLVDKDFWVIAGHLPGGKIYEFGVCFERVLDVCKNFLPEGAKSSIIVHPEYVR